VGAFLSILAKPFVVFFYLVFVRFIEIAVRKWMPECALKRLLLRRW
jgi:hypothetical protein